MSLDWSVMRDSATHHSKPEARLVMVLDWFEWMPAMGADHAFCLSQTCALDSPSS